ncbi:MAG: hypothetical protein U0736_08840 [Gemmataceae bacterium]
MHDALTISSPAIPAEVETFAAEMGVGPYLVAVVDLARQAFPSSAVNVSLGRDAENESHRYIALDVDTGGLAVDELIDGQRVWSTGVGRICPSPDAVHFVLGWR